jgi:hypothetical protein
MAKFVKHDAAKGRENESDTLDDGLDTLTLVPVEEAIHATTMKKVACT